MIKCLRNFTSFPDVTKEIRMEAYLIASERVNGPKEKSMNDT
jgi:hypothetical protein